MATVGPTTGHWARASEALRRETQVDEGRGGSTRRASAEAPAVLRPAGGHISVSQAYAPPSAYPPTRLGGGSAPPQSRALPAAGQAVSVVVVAEQS